jgi:glycosyltransferase involved in cell wall biosynthesis
MIVSLKLRLLNCGAYDEWIEDGETGFLIDPNKPHSEWTRILTMCAKRPDMVKRMGENLHQKTEEAFNMNKVVGQRLNLYKELLVASQAS